MTARRPAPRGYTLLETAVSLSATTVLLLAMGSMMVLAGHALPDGQSRSTRAAEATRALDLIADDLAVATEVSFGGGGSDLTFTVPDRSGDGAEEQGRFRLTGGSLVRRWVQSGTSTATLVSGVSGFTASPVASSDGEHVAVVELVLALDDMPEQPFRRAVALLNEVEAP